VGPTGPTSLRNVPDHFTIEGATGLRSKVRNRRILAVALACLATSCGGGEQDARDHQSDRALQQDTEYLSANPPTAEEKESVLSCIEQRLGVTLPRPKTGETAPQMSDQQLQILESCVYELSLETKYYPPRVRQQRDDSTDRGTRSRSERSCLLGKGWSVKLEMPEDGPAMYHGVLTSQAMAGRTNSSNKTWSATWLPVGSTRMPVDPLDSSR